MENVIVESIQNKINQVQRANAPQQEYAESDTYRSNGDTQEQEDRQMDPSESRSD